MTGAELLVVFIAPRCMETGASADFPPPSLRYGYGKPAQKPVCPPLIAHAVRV
jgi:hypothetical protein